MNPRTKSEQVAMDYQVAARIPFQIWDFARFAIRLVFYRATNRQSAFYRTSRHILSLLFELRNKPVSIGLVNMPLGFYIFRLFL